MARARWRRQRRRHKSRTLDLCLAGTWRLSRRTGRLARVGRTGRTRRTRRRCFARQRRASRRATRQVASGPQLSRRRRLLSLVPAPMHPRRRSDRPLCLARVMGALAARGWRRQWSPRWIRWRRRTPRRLRAAPRHVLRLRRRRCRRPRGGCHRVARRLSSRRHRRRHSRRRRRSWRRHVAAWSAQRWRARAVWGAHRSSHQPSHGLWASRSHQQRSRRRARRSRERRQHLRRRRRRLRSHHGCGCARRGPRRHAQRPRRRPKPAGSAFPPSCRRSAPPNLQRRRRRRLRFHPRRPGAAVPIPPRPERTRLPRHRRPRFSSARVQPPGPRSSTAVAAAAPLQTARASPAVEGAAAALWPTLRPSRSDFRAVRPTPLLAARRLTRRRGHFNFEPPRGVPPMRPRARRRARRCARAARADCGARAGAAARYAREALHGAYWATATRSPRGMARRCLAVVHRRLRSCAMRRKGGGTRRLPPRLQLPRG